MDVAAARPVQPSTARATARTASVPAPAWTAPRTLRTWLFASSTTRGGRSANVVRATHAASPAVTPSFIPERERRRRGERRVPAAGGGHDLNLGRRRAHRRGQLLPPRDRFHQLAGRRQADPAALGGRQL